MLTSLPLTETAYIETEGEEIGVKCKASKNMTFYNRICGT